VLYDGVKIFVWRKQLHLHVVEQHTPEVATIIFVDMRLGKLLAEMLNALG